VNYLSPGDERLADRAPAFSDEDLALRFAERHAHDLRFVAAWNKWLFWNGQHWQFEDTLRAWDFARHVCREAAARCNKPKQSSAIASAKTVSAVERQLGLIDGSRQPSTNGTQIHGN
jgi:putative DNA primase/helicase